MLVTTSVPSITGTPYLFHSLGVIGVSVFSDTDATTMLAVDPIMVPLPPKPAPKTSAHHNGSIGIPVSPNPWMSGISAMVMGTLSTSAERIATPHNSIRLKTIGGKLPACAICIATNLITPEASRPPIRMNSAMKNTKTSQ